jgi:DNA-binding MarR family transcriptional regulator
MSTLTRTIGTTERTLQALLHNRLSAHGLSFPEWVILTQTVGDLTREAMLTALRKGRVAEQQSAEIVLAAAESRGLVTEHSGVMRLTPAGGELFAAAKAAVGAATAQLFEGIGETEIALVREVLEQLTHRAESILSA